MASSFSSLGWYAVIETLADSQLVDLPLLKELVNRAPHFYTDAPGSVRERVALRYLEECASRGFLDTKDRSIDVSMSSEEVLCHNLTKPIDLSKPLQSSIVPITDDIRQFISQKRSILPKPYLDLLKESVLEGDNIVDDNNVDKEQEQTAESLHNDPSKALSSQDALDADKTPTEPLLQNSPTTTTVANGSKLEATRTEPSGDDINQFILKRRAAEPKTSSQMLKESIPETSTPTEPEHDDNLRSNTNLSDDLNDSEGFPEQNQCIICYKGGLLLTCSRKGCGIAVHESCIKTTPSSFDKEGRFYCPCCACTRAAQVYARAKKVFSLARENLSSFLEMEKNGERGKRPAEENRNGKKMELSDDSPEDGDGDANISGDASSTWESASRDSRRVDVDGKRKDKRVKSNDGDMDLLCRRDETAKIHEADLAFERLKKYMYVRSGHEGTSGTREAAPRHEERENERKGEDKGDENIDRKRHRPRPRPRYSNKVAAPCRRNMLPWSTEEEQALREGMQKFGVDAHGRIPWSTILEYRQNVFHRTRLPIDLKDKWRNMMKKEGTC